MKVKICAASFVLGAFLISTSYTIALIQATPSMQTAFAQLSMMVH